MARYSLIMKDKTYMKLLQYGARQGKTMGKLLNEILDAFAKKTIRNHQRRQQRTVTRSSKQYASSVELKPPLK